MRQEFLVGTQRFDLNSNRKSHHQIFVQLHQVLFFEQSSHKL